MNPYQSPRLMKEQVVALRKWYIAFSLIFVIIGLIVIICGGYYIMFKILDFEQSLRHALLDNNIKESYTINLLFSYCLIDLLFIMGTINFLKFSERLF